MELLTINDLDAVLEVEQLVEARTRCFSFGLALNVDVGLLENISSQLSDPKDQLREVLKCWLSAEQCSQKRTRMVLLDALKSLAEKPDQAHALKYKHPRTGERVRVVHKTNLARFLLCV